MRTRQTFLLEVSLRRRDLEFERGFASDNVFGRKEAGKVPADDFIGGVAGYDKGADTPTDDVAIGIEQQERMVAYAVD